GAPGNTNNTTSSANLASLQTVNVQNVTGTATPTSQVSLNANLNAGQANAVGAGATASMDPNDAVNSGINASELIAQTPVDSLTRGDTFTIATPSVTKTFQYGGFSIGRNVTNGALTESGAGLTPLPSNAAMSLVGGNETSTGGGSAQVRIDV